MPDTIPHEAKLMFRDPAEGFTDELLAFQAEGTPDDGTAWDAWRAMAAEQMGHPDFRHFDYWLILDGENVAVRTHISPQERTEEHV